MAPEKRIREGLIANMTTRQKGVAAALVIILGIVVWQIYGLFGGGSTPPPEPAKPAPAQQMAAHAPAQQAQPQAMGAAPAAGAVTPVLPPAAAIPP